MSPEDEMLIDETNLDGKIITQITRTVALVISGSLRTGIAYFRVTLVPDSFVVDPISRTEAITLLAMRDPTVDQCYEEFSMAVYEAMASGTMASETRQSVLVAITRDHQDIGDTVIAADLILTIHHEKTNRFTYTLGSEHISRGDAIAALSLHRKASTDDHR